MCFLIATIPEPHFRDISIEEVSPFPPPLPPTGKTSVVILIIGTNVPFVKNFIL